MTIAMISGHIDLTPQEFETHYTPRIDEAVAQECDFVVGDAPGADAMAQAYLKQRQQGALFKVTVYHAYRKPRHNAGFSTRGGYLSHTAKDSAMTAVSDVDIAWVRQGKETSGTARNLARRALKGEAS